jgi:hypothetical protein
MHLIKQFSFTSFYYFQFVQNAQEFLLPKLKQKYILWFCCDGGLFNKQRTVDDDDEAKSFASMYEDLNLSELEHDDLRMKQVMKKFFYCLKQSLENFFLFPSPKNNQKPQTIRESAKDEYNTYDDYLELYIQFGYVVLFSSVAPFAAFWALFNNFFEIRLDAYKVRRMAG